MCIRDRAGSTVEVNLEGIHLKGSENIVFNSSNISASILEGWDGPNGRFQTPLERLRLEVEIHAETPPAIYGLRVKTRHGASNWIPFAVGRFPEIRESDGNHTVSEAQSVTLPVTVNGRIAKGGEEDYFQLDGRQGEELVVQLQAHPLGSRMDAALTLMGPDGRVHPGPQGVGL